MFFDIYKKLCDEKGVTPSKAATEMGINKGTVSVWKSRGTSPQRAQLQKIATYFNVSADILLDQKEKPADPTIDELVKDDPLAGQLFATYGKVKKEFSQTEIDDITAMMEVIAERKRQKREKGEG